MEIKGIIWVGSSTPDLGATTRFFSEVLQMQVVTNASGFSRLAAANGDRVEFFGPDSIEHAHLGTGPVAGFWVEDAPSARLEMIAANVAEVTELERGEDGHRCVLLPRARRQLLRDV